MADSYDIDEILNELKQRHSGEEPAKDKKADGANENTENIIEKITESVMEKKAEKIVEKSADEPEFDYKAEEKPNEELQTKEEPKTEKEPEVKEEPQEKFQEETLPEDADEEPAEEKDEQEDAEEDEAEDGEIDLFELAGMSSSVENTIKKDEKVKFRKTKKGKIVISVICVLLALLIGAGIFAYVYVNGLLNQVTDNGGEESPANIEQWQGMDELREDFTPVYEAPKSEISNLSDMVKTWYYTGKPASSSHVLNVLLIGEDTRGDEIVDEGFRADSAIVASINKDTGKIILTSILRDTYVYYEREEGNPESGKFSKINEAMSYGGLDCYIRAVENNYKINIDNYVLVNFESFKTIIDTLNGVDITITSREIKEINNHQKRYGNVTIKKTFDGDEGMVHLNGEQALAYCRIRYIDSDGQRANRQKTVLSVLLKKAQESSMFKSAEIVTKLLPYVKTGATKQEVVNLATYAIKNGWIKFKLETYNVPEDITNEDGTVTQLAKGGTYKGAWMWRADLPLAAQITQQRIYGKSSIVLNESRPKFLNLA